MGRYLFKKIFIMPNYKVISSSCFGGNKVFYCNEIFKDHDVSEQDLAQLLKGGYIVETDQEANKSNEILAHEIEAEKAEEKLEIPFVENKEVDDGTNVDPADLVSDKKQNKILK